MICRKEVTGRPSSAAPCSPPLLPLYTHPRVSPLHARILRYRHDMRHQGPRPTLLGRSMQPSPPASPCTPSPPSSSTAPRALPLTWVWCLWPPSPPCPFSASPAGSDGLVTIPHDDEEGSTSSNTQPHNPIAPQLEAASELIAVGSSPRQHRPADDDPPR